MAESTKVEVLVEGGKATPGPPIGPALGPMGVNIPAIIKEINKKTKDMSGMKVPVIIQINSDKSFEIIPGLPPTSALLIKESGTSKGSGATGSEIIGNISLKACIQIAKLKKEKMLGANLKALTKEVLGTAMSCGITCENENPVEVSKKIDNGEFNKLFSNE
ncbi:MAG: 50S ribosomal protein L11 [Promethearchaeota archaeon]